MWGRTWSIYLGLMLPFLKGAAKWAFTSHMTVNAVEDGARGYQSELQIRTLWAGRLSGMNSVRIVHLMITQSG